MKSWEFLIQKEGDRQWHPINSPTWQLEAGKYRILAQSNRFNSILEVRITCQSGEGQQYQRRVNSQGLVMILPYTELSPGTIWDIRCYGDVLSEFLGENWQEKLTLTILPSVVTNNPVPVAEISPNSSLQLSNSGNSQAQYYLQQLEQLLREKVEPTLNNHQVEESEAIPEEAEIKPLIKLSLEQQDLMRNPDENINLSGNIEAIAIKGDLAFTGKLRCQLKDPETEEILLTEEYVLSDERLPYQFNYTLEIPQAINSDTLAGEVVLETMRGFILDESSFSLVTHQYNPVNYTIELVDTENEDAYRFDLELSERVKAVSNHLELPDTNKYSQLFPSSFYQSRKVLPPKLNRNVNPGIKTHKQLKLPQIAR
ncbi:hypothetical protein VB715_03310 [Crocosphaera sp. UHCC 0190]|uniref:hypothetical protein n=1 Tax=Crocosphaera sp. UHCC 0190 TaxID=3110246 RepID=UPI002B207F6E|nr:hypothetical protein [Crocosphaera sp. UHCC 0190]MEA5508782.1 hypothetical protein [Crocosphaera sp. UHCC 0190]